MRTTSLALILALALASGVLLVACGDDDDSSAPATQATTATTQATTEAAADPPSSLTIHMTEFAFDPNDAVAKVGKVTIAAPNDGKVVHELVLLKTDADPANVPKKGDEVDESTSVGELADVEPGATKEDTFDLEAGKYVMICALPGHYEGGMYGSLTVK